MAPPAMAPPAPPPLIGHKTRSAAVNGAPQLSIGNIFLARQELKAKRNEALKRLKHIGDLPGTKRTNQQLTKALKEALTAINNFNKVTKPQGRILAMLEQLSPVVSLLENENERDSWTKLLAQKLETARTREERLKEKENKGIPPVSLRNLMQR